MSRRRRIPTPPSETPAAQTRRVLIALAVWIGVAGLCAWCTRLPAPRPAEGSEAVFSAERALADLREISAGLGPRPMGSADNRELLTRLDTHLRWLGYETERQADWILGPYGTLGRPENLIVRRAGRADLAPVLVVAHHDSVGAGVGAADDLAGVAALCEVARVLKGDREPGREVIFLFTDGEETGLLGAASFMRHHPDAERIGAVVNLEARGTTGLSYLFETGLGDGPLIDLYAGAVKRRPTASSVSVAFYRLMPHDTDFTVFRERGLPGANFAFIGDLVAYHTPLDTADRLDPRSLQHQGDQVLALVRALRAHEGELAGEDAVHASLLGMFVVAYSTSWTFPIGLVSLVVVVLGAWRVVRSGRARWGGAFAGVVLTAATLVLAALAAYGLDVLLERATADSRPWRAHPLPARAAYLGVALGALGVAAGVGRRLADSVSLALGVALAWGLAGLGAAIFLPGAAYLFVPTVLGLGLLALAVRLQEAVEARFARIALFTLPLAVVPWTPILDGASDAFGLAAPGLLVATDLWLATLILPVLAAAQPALGTICIGLGTALVSVGGAATLLLPHRTPERPARVNLEYEVDGDEARWIVATAGVSVPAPLARLHEFEPAGGLGAGGHMHASFVAPAPVLDLAGARFEIASVELDDEGRRHVRGRVFAGEGALTVTISARVDQGAGHVERVRVAGLDAGPSPTVVAPPAEGFPVELTLVNATGVLTRTGPAPDGDGYETTEFDYADSTWSVVVWSEHAGLPAAGAPLLEARPADCVPSHEGDVTTVVTRIPLTP